MAQVRGRPHVSRVPQRDAIYITRPERIIWPVIALVAVTLFTEAGKATVARLGPVLAAQATVTSTLPRDALSRDAEGSGEAMRPSDGARVVARNGTRPVPHVVRTPLRRAAPVIAPTHRTAERRELAARSHRQRVVSPRPGALVIHFATAPPVDAARNAPMRAHAGAA